MKILIINPNSTAAMTSKLEELLAPLSTPDVSPRCAPGQDAFEPIGR
jgi:Asp/Glu/hydantoin racemase